MRQGDVALEVADLDDQLVALLGHHDLCQLDVWQRQAQDVLVVTLDDLLWITAVEDHRWVGLAPYLRALRGERLRAQNLARAVRGVPERQRGVGRVDQAVVATLLGR